MYKKGIKAISVLLAVFFILGTFVGCSNSDSSDDQVDQQGDVKEFDVVVVGSGAAGLSSAIEAAESGAKVALLEKLGMVGGSTLVSGGIVYGTGSDIQKELGIEDSVDDLVKYWSDRAEGKNDEEFLRFVAERSGETINWLVDLGVEFNDPTPAGTSPVLRAHTCTERGNGIITNLKEYAESKGVEFFLNTAATEILTDNSEVSGVKAVDKDGKEIVFNSKAVVLATGGFDRNPELIKQYAAVAEGHESFAGAGNSGDGLVMAQKLNADVVSNGGVIGFRKVVGEDSYTTDICMLMWSPYLYVNVDGQRFIDETSDYPIFYRELIKQKDQVSYLIFDGNTYVETLDKAVEKGSAFAADSIAELAEKAGIDPAGLEETVKNYNKMIEDGKDTEFGKDLTNHTPIEKPKYYALKVVPAILGTLSGVKIDLDTQVIDTNGDVIKGLYAAGEVANGSFFNEEYPASGTSIQMCLTFGRVAGQNAAEFAANK